MGEAVEIAEHRLRQLPQCPRIRRIGWRGDHLPQQRRQQRKQHRRRPQPPCLAHGGVGRVAAGCGDKGLFEQRQLGGKPADLGRHLAIIGVAPLHRHMRDPEAQLPGPHRQVEQQVVDREHPAKRADAGVQQIGCGIGAKAVGGVREPVPPRHAQHRGVDQAVGDGALERGVLRRPAEQIARALHIVAALLELGDHRRDRLDPVLAVAVDSDDPGIALPQAPGIGHAQLGRELAGAGLGQDRAHADRRHEVSVKRAVARSAVGDHHVDRQARCLDAAELAADPLALVDNRDDERVAMRARGIERGLVRGHLPCGIVEDRGRLHGHVRFPTGAKTTHFDRTKFTPNDPPAPATRIASDHAPGSARSSSATMATRTTSVASATIA